MKEILRRCVICGKVTKLLETYLLAEGPKSDIVRNVCRACYLLKSREIRQTVRQESEEGFIP
jgi:hypothetical protein